MAHQLASQLATLETLISQVPGVHAARIILDADGNIDTIRIVGTPEGQTQQIVHEAAVALYIHAGLRVDPQRIAVVYFAEAAPPAPDVRVQLHEIIHTAGEPIVAITLTLHNRRILGIGRSQPGEATNLAQLAGEATTHAINRLIAPEGQVRLEHIQCVQIGEHDICICLVQLTLTAEDGPTTGLGVSMIYGDVAVAAARAVLDAVNRRLSRLMQAWPGGSSRPTHDRRTSP
jgi:hypothetical protein